MPGHHPHETESEGFQSFSMQVMSLNSPWTWHALKQQAVQKRKGGREIEMKELRKKQNYRNTSHSVLSLSSLRLRVSRIKVTEGLWYFNGKKTGNSNMCCYCSSQDTAGRSYLSLLLLILQAAHFIPFSELYEVLTVEKCSKTYSLLGKRKSLIGVCFFCLFAFDNID